MSRRHEQGAVDLAARGYYPFACQERGKRPVTTNGFKAATRDERELMHMWDRHPNANIGIDCGRSGIAVLDIDPKAGADPREVIAELGLENAPVVLTGEAPEPNDEYPRSLAGVRGAHILFKGSLPTRETQIDGVEVRGVGAYVLAPPSVHPSGVEYEGAYPPVAQLPEVPQQVLAICARRNNGPAPPVGDRIPKGTQHRTLVSLAGSMRHRGMGETEIAAALKETNRLRCEVPAADKNIEEIARSVCKYPPGAPAAVNGAASFTPRQPATDSDYAVTFTSDKPPKLVLPDVPAHDDLAGLAAWLTCVLRLDPNHPVTGAVHQGLRGQDGHVEIRRAGNQKLRFEPAATVNTARRFLPALGWQLLPTDGEPYGFKDEHARRIAHVLKLLCGITEAATEAQQTNGIIGTFLQAAVPVEGHTTYGTGAQKYEAATALARSLDEQTGRPVGPQRYLIDSNTGEFAIRASDLQAAARVHTGSSLPHGWLVARMEGLGWDRIQLDGHALPGRAGNSGPHARCDVYRGHLAPARDTDGSGE